MLCRCVCKNNRSFIMHILNPDQSVFLVIERPLRLYYQTIICRDQNGVVLGSVEVRTCNARTRTHVVVVFAAFAQIATHTHTHMNARVHPCVRLSVRASVRPCLWCAVFVAVLLTVSLL